MKGMLLETIANPAMQVIKPDPSLHPVLCVPIAQKSNKAKRSDYNPGDDSHTVLLVSSK